MLSFFSDNDTARRAADAHFDQLLRDVTRELAEERRPKPMPAPEPLPVAKGGQGRATADMLDAGLALLVLALVAVGVGVVWAAVSGGGR